MSRNQWLYLLQQLDRLTHLDTAADTQLRRALPPEVLGGGWCGANGTTPAELRDLELRLETTLPPSYREFLSASNGWWGLNEFVWRLYPTDEVDWFRVRHQEWIDCYVDPSDDEGGPSPEFPDAEYFVYGEHGFNGVARMEQLSACLQLSDVGDNAVILLNPLVVTEDGEWEAWYLAAWRSGAWRYPSFLRLVEHAMTAWEDRLQTGR